MIVRMIAVMTVAAAALVTVGVLPEAAAQRAAPTKVRLPDESAGIDGIARTLISAFDQADIVALGEAHGRRLDSDLQIALVRHPDFAKKVRSIVVEFGSTTEQSVLDRYIRGENISRSTGAGLEDDNPGPQRHLGLADLRRVSRSCARCQFKAASRCARARLRR